jgi:hypothetical protein
MDWKGYVGIVVIVIVGIYALKWVNSQWSIPVLGAMIEGV